MPVPLHSQTVIAFIWDFDCTLIVGNQQEPLFEEYGVDGDTFWAEVEALPEFHRERGEIISRDTAYLLHLLSHVEAGVFPGLTNARLRELGGRLRPSPGIPEFLDTTRRHASANPAYAAQGITVEHYAISTGLRPMVEGSPIAPFLDGIWANTFVEHTAPPGYLGRLAVSPGAGRITRQGYAIDNTTKTRAVFEINKGANCNPGIDVNARMTAEQRRVPFGQMVYIADGPSDVPVFSVLNERGGRTFGVYQTVPRSNFRRVKDLQEQGRIQGMAEADFRPGEAAHLWLMDCLEQIAGEIVGARRQAIAGLPPPPGHG
ncbi:MAG: HAD family hydrolase [Actinomycetota bacterium]